jgi:hypothetical protein
MPRFNNETRKKRIKELMRILEKGLEVAKRDFDIAVGKDFAKLYKQRWAEQKELRNIEVPSAVKEYEQMLQEAVMWHGRLDAYSGRNPKTGEMIPIAARRVVTFHASQKLKDAVESHARENRT